MSGGTVRVPSRGPAATSESERMPSTPQRHVIPWHRAVLRTAAVSDFVWGTFVVVFPLALFRWAGADPLPHYPELWQCLGMIVGVYGIGFWIASADPVRHWAIILVGLLGKVFGPLVFLQAVLTDRLPAKLGITILTNDLIWWLPFAAILLHARVQNNIVLTEPVIEEPIPPMQPATRTRAPRSSVVWSSLQSTSRDT